MDKRNHFSMCRIPGVVARHPAAKTESAAVSGPRNGCVTAALGTLILACAVTGGFIHPVAAAESGAGSWAFDTDPSGVASDAFSVDSGQWEVVEDTTAPSPSRVLAQRARNESATFNLIRVRDLNLRDADLAVRFKAVGGSIDQGGGLVWRAVDAGNYYLARYNPLEGNYRVYKVAAGERTELGSADIPAAPGWHRLRVIMIGDHIEAYYDGRKHIDVNDSTLADAGSVGLWTKADAQTHFDDFRARGGRTALAWESTFTPEPPVMDGTLDEVWRRAAPLTVEIREAIGGQDPRPVILRALHTVDHLYVLAQWPDATRSDMRDPYVWNAAQRSYARPSRPDDQFALEFPLSGDFTVSMLANDQDYIADVWHWKAGRGNPVGWVDDKRHIISREPVEGALAYALGGRGTVYIARLMDAGSPSYVLREAPSGHVGDLVDSFQPQTPTDSLADVRGKGLHDGKTWTLEMSRRFNTGHDDDAGLVSDTETYCAIAVLDDELYWNHSVSPLIELRFLPDATNAPR